VNTALWIAQILAALGFGAAGFMKLTQPKAVAYERGLKWVEDFSEGQLKLIGVLEILGAIGLILPWALNVLPVLTPVAAVGLMIVMLGAGYTHLRRGENPMIVLNAVLFVLAAFVAWGRFTGAA
jgi:uncharacterized membrane protein YphA (DoxX/SURF4 family)